MTDETKGNGGKKCGFIGDAVVPLFNPVVLVVLTMLGGIYVLLWSVTFGYDKGLMANMIRHDFARGLITYLFAVTTIGTAVVLVLYGLTSSSDDDKTEKRFQRGKEVLSLLLGVFGTVIGFYFASDIKSANALSISPLLLNPQFAVSGEDFTITTRVNGSPPYQFGVGIGADSEIRYDQNVGQDSWVYVKRTAPAVSEPTSVDIKLSVKDSSDRTTAASAKLQVSPKSGASSGPATR